MASSSASEETILSEKKITLTSKDGDTFEVPEIVALKMQTIKNMIEDDCTENAIPLPNVEGQILSKVIEYCKKHVEAEATMAAANKGRAKRMEKELEAWDKEFIVNFDTDSLHDILIASNYLHVNSLLELGCQRAADVIRGKSPDKIREMFNIPNEFTKEENEQIRKENQWVFNDA